MASIDNTILINGLYGILVKLRLMMNGSDRLFFYFFARQTFVIFPHSMWVVIFFERRINWCSILCRWLSKTRQTI